MLTHQDLQVEDNSSSGLISLPPITTLANQDNSAIIVRSQVTLKRGATSCMVILRLVPLGMDKVTMDITTKTGTTIIRGHNTIISFTDLLREKG